MFGRGWGPRQGLGWLELVLGPDVSSASSELTGLLLVMSWGMREGGQWKVQGPWSTLRVGKK